MKKNWFTEAQIAFALRQAHPSAVSQKMRKPA
jgi:hypothetical protein